MNRNLRLELQYDGTDFHGWQIQPNLPTIQGSLTQAIHRITTEKLHVNGSGRTDAGAHALEQVCNLLTLSKIPLANFQKAMNSLLPPSTRSLRFKEPPKIFLSRLDAKISHYRYRFLIGYGCPP